jgi:hypothetical protein
MLQNMLCAVAAAAMAIATEAMADSSTNGRQQDAHAAAYSMPQHRRWHVAHRSFTHGFGAGSAAYYGYASAFREPGYINVPRILDGACNLPTSACPNEFRNVN